MADNFDKNLGAELRRQRELKHLTQLEVANFCGVTKMNVSYWESGRNAMYAWQLKKYCEFLGVTVSEILERT